MRNSRLWRRFPRPPGERRLRHHLRCPKNFFGAPTAPQLWIAPLGAPSSLQVVLKLPRGHEDSEYVLSFKIGQREGGFYSARTDTESPNSALVYRFGQQEALKNWDNLNSDGEELEKFRLDLVFFEKIILIMCIFLH